MNRRLIVEFDLDLVHPACMSEALDAYDRRLGRRPRRAARPGNAEWNCAEGVAATRGLRPYVAEAAMLRRRDPERVSFDLANEARLACCHLRIHPWRRSHREQRGELSHDGLFRMRRAREVDQWMAERVGDGGHENEGKHEEHDK